MTSTRTLYPVVVACLLVVATLPTPVAATTGTVTSDTPDVATSDSEITVSFNITNTDIQPAAYFLDVSLPEGWTVVGHTEPDDVTWSASKSEWFIQDVAADQSISPSIMVSIPADASQAGTIETILRSRTGIQEGTTDTIEVYSNQNQIKVANTRLSPTTVTDTPKSHTLTFDAFSVSADGEPDTVTISLPSGVRLGDIQKVSVTNHPYEVTTTKRTADSLTIEVNPDEPVDTVDITYQIQAQFYTTQTDN